jgi:peptidoglycan/xylan/chitin deacetylase (PgdA/CDA1 family)
VGVLDALDKHGAKGTFFVNANHFVTSPMSSTNYTYNAQTRAVLQRMVRDGHAVENHSWNHRNFTTLTSAQGLDDINRTSAAIQAATGVRPRYFRAPFFAYGEGARNSPLPIIGSGLDTNDWDPARSPNGQAIANFLLNQPNIRNGSLHGGIVLMHDGPVSTQTARTVQSLDIFIPQMQAMGYEFVTLEELFRRTNYTPPQYSGNANNIVRWSNTSNSPPR